MLTFHNLTVRSLRFAIHNGLPLVVITLLCIPLVTTTGLTVGLPIFTVLAWRSSEWSLLGQLHYSILMVAALSFASSAQGAQW